MKLNPQQQQIFNLLDGGGWVCSNLIQDRVSRDYRKRISEMREKGYAIDSMACDKTCHIPHKARVFMYKLQDVPKHIVNIVDNDTLPPVKVDGRWQPQPVYRKEVVPL